MVLPPGSSQSRAKESKAAHTQRFGDLPCSAAYAITVAIRGGIDSVIGCECKGDGSVCADLNGGECGR